MPPKSKKMRHSLEAAAKGREVLLQTRIEPDATVFATMEGVTSESEARAGDSAVFHEEPGPSHPPVDMIEDDACSLEVMETFVESWVQALDHEDRKSLAVLLCFVLVKELSFTETNSAALAARVISKNEKTVRRWRTDVVSNGGALSESNQGRYQRTGVLWANEELNKKATEYVRSNAAVKGKPNMTSIEFCKWVNKTLLPNSTLEPGFPRQVSVETSRKCLHEMGFEVVTARKGIFVDGHERPDVIESRKNFLRKMVKIGFLHFTSAPTDEARQALPEDIDPPILERREKLLSFSTMRRHFNPMRTKVLSGELKGQKS